MHRLGVVFIVLIVVGSLAAVALSAKLLSVRNSWAKSVADLRAKNEQNAQEIAEKQRRLQQMRGELARTMLGWDKYWTDVDIGLANLDEGIVQSGNLGRNHGLGVPERPEQPVVFLFRPTPESQFVFAGPFQAIEIRENQAAFQATWRVRSGEPQSWSSGSWRVRSLVPSSRVDRFMELQGKLTLADELLAQKERNVSLQDQLIATAQRDLIFRTEELIGGGEQPGEAGLLSAIEAEERERNAALAEVDRLRRELNTAVARRKSLIQQNLKLANQLPGAKSQVATKLTGD